MGRKAASSLAVHEYLQAHPLTKIGPAAIDLKLSIPTVTSALETLTKLRIAKESTGKRREELSLGRVRVNSTAPSAIPGPQGFLKHVSWI